MAQPARRHCLPRRDRDQVIPRFAENALIFFNRFFPNPYITVAFEKEYAQYLRHYDLASLWQIPIQVTTYGGLSGALGPIFLMAPIGLLALRSKQGRQVWLAAFVFGAPYFSNIGARFLIPVLPFIALAVMMVLSRVPAVALAVVVLHAVLSWPPVVLMYAREDPWKFNRVPWREALRLRDPDVYLTRRLANYGVARLIDNVTEPGATVLSFEPIPESYTSRRILIEYQAASNRECGAILRSGVLPELAPTLRLRFAFPRQTLQAVRVVETNSGTDLWNIHELRIFDGSSELPRKPQWRLRARPYAWGIQDAFDNSLVTFWISGQELRPGQFVQVDFGGGEDADAVQIDAAPNQWGVRLRLEGKTVRGQWVSLSSSPRQSEMPRPIGLRRAAAEELKRRGVDYVLMFDKNPGAEDLQRNADEWGIRQVAEYRSAKLYQLP